MDKMVKKTKEMEKQNNLIDVHMERIMKAQALQQASPQDEMMRQVCECV